MRPLSAATRSAAGTGAPFSAGRDRGKVAARILVVEDEAEIAALIAYQLTREGYRVETALNGAAALDALHRDLPDLLVLDRMLPGVSGDDVLKAVRADPATRTVPVLVLTARREQVDRIRGFELGADDYLTKPFSPRELVLRVDAILRRAHGELNAVSGGGRILRAGHLRVDVGAHIVTLGDGEIRLTPTEFRLLRTLMERRGRTQSRRQLLTEAWHIEPGTAGRLHTRTVDMHVRRLRGKLGAVGEWIETVRGSGTGSGTRSGEGGHSSRIAYPCCAPTPCDLERKVPAGEDDTLGCHRTHRLCFRTSGLRWSREARTCPVRLG